MKFSVFAIAALAATSSMVSAAAASRAKKLEKKNSSLGGNSDSISSSTTLTVTNQTPKVDSGATIYNLPAQTTISVFGASCPADGCVVPGGASQDVGNSGSTWMRAPFGTKPPAIVTQITAWRIGVPDGILGYRPARLERPVPSP